MPFVCILKTSVGWLLKILFFEFLENVTIKEPFGFRILKHLRIQIPSGFGLLNFCKDLAVQGKVLRLVLWFFESFFENLGYGSKLVFLIF